MCSFLINIVCYWIGRFSGLEEAVFRDAIQSLEGQLDKAPAKKALEVFYTEESGMDYQGFNHSQLLNQPITHSSNQSITHLFNQSINQSGHYFHPSYRPVICNRYFFSINVTFLQCFCKFCIFCVWIKWLLWKVKKSKSINQSLPINSPNAEPLASMH